jgi:hypothetical protein
MKLIKTILDCKNVNNEVRVYRNEFEYECRLYLNGVLNEEATYFTDNKDDALQTANAMIDKISTN